MSGRTFAALAELAAYPADEWVEDHLLRCTGHDVRELVRRGLAVTRKRRRIRDTMLTAKGRARAARLVAVW